MSWQRVRDWSADHPDVVDAVVAALLLLLGAMAIQANAGLVRIRGGEASTSPVTLAWFVALVGVLAVRRRFPVATCAIACVAFGAFQGTGGVESFVSNVSLFLAVHAAGAYGRPRRRTVVRTVGVVGMFAWLAWAMATSTPDPEMDVVVLGLTQVLSNVFFFGAAWVFGDLSRLRAARERQLAARTRELEAQRERTAAQAVVAERVRIARELHDVLAHHVSVMGVQAAAARRVLDRDPDRAVAPLTAIESSARSAIEELQRMLDVLRDDDAPADRGPVPGLDRLPVLVEELRGVGLGVTLQVDGRTDDLPDSVHLSAYRVAQEALTNVVKHAGPGAHTTVTVIRDARWLTVTVVDDGRGAGPAPDVVGTGSGLVGMGERVAVHGGTLRAAPRRGGGWHVHARLPVRAPAPATVGP